MTTTKNKGLYIAIVAIILGIFNVLAWTIPFPRGGNYWVGYGFAMAAIFLTAGVILYTFDKEDLKSKFYRVPLIMVAWRYLIMQLIVSAVQLGLDFTFLPFQIGLILNSILLGGCLIGLFTAEMGKNEIERIDEKVKEKVFYIKSLQVDVEGLVSKVSDGARKSIKDLAETIKYSDPMSSPQLSGIENKIEAKVTELTESVNSDDKEKIAVLCNELQQLFAERNRKCKLLK